MQSVAAISYPNWLRAATLAGCSLAASLLAASAMNPNEPGFPAGIHLAEKSRGEAAIAALGARLPEVAAFYGKSPQQLRELFRADHSLWIDATGQLFYACELKCPDCNQEAAAADGVIAESIGPTDPTWPDTNDTFFLHSRPGANRVIYLDFDGHVDNTPGNWADGASAPAYNIPNSDPKTFSEEEKNRIIEIWQRVSEDFSMYEIDVTTQEPPIEDLRKTSSSDTRYGVRCVIGGSGNDWYGAGVGGVAFVGSFDSNQDVPCWVFPAGLGYTAKNITEAASHEVGHTLGLLHDGREVPSEDYYVGQGNWAPIMGVGYYEPITQWSKGEYTSPSNPQDDLAVMLTQGAVYRPDDHGGTVATATKLSADSSSASINGVIERNTDLDFFRIDAVGGSLVINAIPAPRGPNLRLEVKLYNSAGTELQTATSADTTAGTQPVTLTRTVTAGVYYVSVNGIGNGDPLTTGYSDYASIGQYKVTLTGVVPGGFTWTSATAGTKQWNTTANWASGTLPNAAGISVRVNNDIAGDQTIQLASATTVGSLDLGDSNSTHAFTLVSSGGSMIFNNSGIAAALNKTSGGNDIISAPVSLVDALVVTQSASGTLAFSGGISGAKAVTKAGAGTVVFSSPNSYTGVTTLSDGLLRLDNANGLPGGVDNTSGAGESALAFEGGVLGLASGDFTRLMGTGAGQLDWVNGSGGFAAFGADREVRLNNGTGAFSWQTAIIGPGNILILSHPTATHTLNFRNGISFAGAKRTVKVEDGDAAVDAILSGLLSGGGGFSKTGPGVLSINNANTHTGVTTVADGMLRLQNASALPSGNLELTGGGVLGLGAADFTARTIGTGLDQVQWTGSGGFAAFGADRAVKFSDTPSNWTATNFIGNGRVLILSHDTADATLDWQQRISLAGNLRIIQVDDGSAAIDAKMSGIIAGGSSGTSNRLSKSGAGTLAFTAQNTYWGDTIIGAGTLMIGDGGTVGGVSQNSPNITVGAGAILAANRSDTLTQGTDPLKVAITGDGGFTQAGSGNTVLMLANAYTGPTTIDSGTLSLGANNVLPDASAVLLGNATLNAATTGTETAGTLDVTAAATINLGTGAELAFADSSAVDWTGGTLNITGTLGTTSLRFGTNSTGLTPSQLAAITSTGFASFSLNASGYLIGTPLTGYPAWKLVNAPTGIPTDDFDNDGVPNAIEYILGGSAATNDLAKLPAAVTSGGDIVFTFVRDQASIDGTTTVTIEVGENLTAWPDLHPVPAAAVSNNPGLSVEKNVPTAGKDTVRLVIPLSVQPKFARLKATP